jgi:hypothetical protein
MKVITGKKSAMVDSMIIGFYGVAESVNKDGFCMVFRYVH